MLRNSVFFRILLYGTERIETEDEGSGGETSQGDCGESRFSVFRPANWFGACTERCDRAPEAELSIACFLTAPP